MGLFAWLLFLSAGLLAAQSSADVGELLRRAAEAQERGDLNGTVRELEQAVRQNPSHAEAWARLGMVQRRLTNLDSASRALERSVRISPDPRVRVLLAFTYIDQGRARDAIPLLKSSFEGEQTDTVKTAVGQRLVECYLATGAAEQAMPALQTLRRIAPDDPGVLYLAAKVYMSLWNASFQHLLAKAPSSYQVNLIRAEALEAQERYAEAAHEYRQIVKSNPELHGIHYGLARALMRSGAGSAVAAEATWALRKELELNPNHGGALVELGELYFRNGELQEAAEQFSKLLKIAPEHFAATLGLAKVLIAQKQWANALNHLQAAEKIAPAEPAVQYNLMLAYRGLGRTEESRRAFAAFERLKQQQSPASFVSPAVPR